MQKGLIVPRKAKKPRENTDKQVGQLLSVGAFWKNDKPGGIGLVIRSDTIGTAAMQRLQVDLQESLESYRNHANPSYVPVYFSQLEEVAALVKRGQELNNQTIVITITNIAYLVETGSLQSDNWNGVVFTRDI